MCKKSKESKNKLVWNLKAKCKIFEWPAEAGLIYSKPPTESIAKYIIQPPSIIHSISTPFWVHTKSKSILSHITNVFQCNACCLSNTSLCLYDIQSTNSQQVHIKNFCLISNGLNLKMNNFVQINLFCIFFIPGGSR